jgi:hypothetical protein
LNTLGICERLGEDPAAERLLRNMIRHATVGIGQPLADPPANFEQHLNTLGY